MKMKLCTFAPSWSPSTLDSEPSDTVAQRLRAALRGPERHAERIRYVRETVIGHLASVSPRLTDLLLAVEAALSPRQGAGYESTRRTLALDAAEVAWHRAASGRAWDAAIAEAEAGAPPALETADLPLLTEYLVAARDLVGSRDRDADPGLDDILALMMTCLGVGRLLERYVTDGAEDGVDALALELVRTAQWCSDSWGWLQGAGSLWDRGSMRGIRRIAAALDPDPRHRHPLPGTRAPVDVQLHDQIVVRGLMLRGERVEADALGRLPEHGIAWRRGVEGPVWVLELFTPAYEQALERLGWRQVPCEVLRAEYEAAWGAEEAAQAQASAEREAADEERRAEILAHPAHLLAERIVALEPQLAWPRLSETTAHTLWTETEVHDGTWGQTYWLRVTPAFWHARSWLREQMVNDVHALLDWPGVSLCDRLRAHDHAWARDHARLLASLPTRTTPCPGFESEYASVISVAAEIADRLEELVSMLPTGEERD